MRFDRMHSQRHEVGCSLSKTHDSLHSQEHALKLRQNLHHCISAVDSIEVHSRLQDQDKFLDERLDGLEHRMLRHKHGFLMDPVRLMDVYTFGHALSARTKVELLTNCSMVSRHTTSIYSS